MKVAIISILAVILLAIIGAGVWALTKGEDQPEQTSERSSTSQASDSSQANSEEEVAVDTASVITYTDEGFNVSKDTVASGSTILVVNQSNKSLDFSSDPHPQHTDNSELNTPTIAPGEQTSFVVEASGRWGFHNHLDDDHSGFITVTD